jgi:hypothetical protein
MTELELFRWIKEWEPEYRWDINGSTNEEDVIIWISIYALPSFLALLPYSLFDEGGIEVRLQDKAIAIWASDICYPLDIIAVNVFPKE